MTDTDYTVVTHYIPELRRIDGQRLGRHVEHDSRSLNYVFDASDIASVTNVRHSRLIPVLDQGNLGSCTGNAAAGALGTDPLYVSKVTQTLSTTDANADEQVAVSLYSAATGLDNVPGTYPPDDTGSTGLAVAKAALQAGLITGYQHVLTLNDTIKTLQTTAVIAGVNWYEGFDVPDPSGRVTIAGQVRGGHEFVIDEVDVDNQLFGATNSWGTSWGLGGRFYFSWADFEQLLSEQGDVTVFVPLVVPQPPTPPTPPAPPVPTPSPEDVALNAAILTWQKAKGFVA